MLLRPTAHNQAAVAIPNRQRVEEVEAAAEKHGLMPVPQFAEQGTPFWEVGRPATAGTVSPVCGTRSVEELRSNRRWRGSQVRED